MVFSQKNANIWHYFKPSTIQQGRYKTSCRSIHHKSVYVFLGVVWFFVFFTYQGGRRA